MIDPLSLVGLYIEPHFDDTSLGSATGFVIKDEENIYLATNWHVVTGRNPDTNEVIHEKGGVPNSLIIFFHNKLAPPNSIEWIKIKISLYKSEEINEDNKKWIEHPINKSIDVILLPLKLDENIQIYPLELSLAKVDMRLFPALPISMLGFPDGRAAGGKLPIWVTGFIASEPEINIDKLPLVYVSALGEKGLSGSLVVARLSGGYYTNDGSFIISGSGYCTKFIGIYSGRISMKSKVCRVWKPIVFEQILKNLKVNNLSQKETA